MTTNTEPIDLSRVHFIGIGGAGMSALAHILLDRGSVVTGSDQRASAIIDALRVAGAQIAIGHDEANLDLADGAPTVVVTSFAAIPKDNAELRAAYHRGIPVIRRSDLLAIMMDGYTEVLIAGTHGKTSTTSMTAIAMQHAGLDPSFMIGGQLTETGAGYHNGSSKIFIAEADESDGSFLIYSPTIEVITNIEPDHLDFFGTPGAYFGIFERFIDCLNFGGHAVVCLDDEPAAALGKRAIRGSHETVGYGTAAAAARHPEIPALAVIVSEQLHPEGTHVVIEIAEQTVELLLQVPGHHMVLNAAAALAAGYLAGGEPAQLAAGLSAFSGVKRRFELRGQVKAGHSAAGARIFDDYAHHPTEVAAVLRTARAAVTAAGRGKVVVAFQPHLYSRTKEFAAEFAQALSLADAVVVLGIYGAREKPIPGVDEKLISDRIIADTVRNEPDLQRAPETIAALVGPDDLVFTMGAGSVTSLADPILALLEA